MKDRGHVTAVKRRHKRVVRKPARPAEVEPDAVLAGPAVERFREELGAIVDPEKPRADQQLNRL